MQEPASNLQTIMDEINDKIFSSFTHQEQSHRQPAQVVVCSQIQIKKQLETQPQTPIKQDFNYSLRENQTQLEFIESQPKIEQEQRDSLNKKSNNQSMNECQIELTYSPEKINENQQIHCQAHNLVESAEKYERLITVQPQELQDELITYQSLTQKFEVALSRLKHTQSGSLNLNEFAARQQHYMKKKTTELNLLRQQKQKQVLRLCPAKPLINSRSQKLLVNHKPIQNRYQTIVQQKKKKLERQQAQQLAKKIQQEQQQLSQIQEYQQEIRRKLGNSVRSQADYYNQMKDWVLRRDKKIEDLAQKKKEQSKDQATFKPVINKKSELLIKKNVSRIPIYDKAPLPKKNLNDSNCTFKPNLTKKVINK